MKEEVFALFSTRRNYKDDVDDSSLEDERFASDGGLGKMRPAKTNDDLQKEFDAWMDETAPEGGYETIDYEIPDTDTIEQKPIMGELEGMDDPLDVPWRKQTEKIIKEVISFFCVHVSVGL